MIMWGIKLNLLPDYFPTMTSEGVSKLYISTPSLLRGIEPETDSNHLSFDRFRASSSSVLAYPVVSLYKQRESLAPHCFREEAPTLPPCKGKLEGVVMEEFERKNKACAYLL